MKHLLQHLQLSDGDRLIKTESSQVGTLKHVDVDRYDVLNRDNEIVGMITIKLTTTINNLKERYHLQQWDLNGNVVTEKSGKNRT